MKKLQFHILLPVAVAALVVVLLMGMDRGERPVSDLSETANTDVTEEYVVLGWNDLGMHCYNRDFQDLAVLPPYNTLWAQVIRVGDPPQVVTSGITVTYSFIDNTYSAGKSNFWEYDLPLFGVDLAPNVGLAGKGLSGVMDAKADHFVAEGIPLTEFRDSNLTTPYPYQLATIVVYSAQSGVELARTVAVAPVSTEMHCDNCHYDGGVEGIATGRVETNILTLHDGEDTAGSIEISALGDSLMLERPVLCAKCHASNALGAAGEPGVPNLSKAMHEKHAGKLADSTAGCYNCHPGPTTQCLRDVMSQEHAMGCVDCHGGMEQIAQNPSPWLNEPRCDSCHDEGAYDQNHALYRMSSEHGGVYCAGCHDSPHAIAPSREANDALKFIGLQGHAGPVDSCTVCHLSTPTGPGPHGLPAGNAAPTFTSTPVTIAVADVPYTYTATTTDPDPGDTRTLSAIVKPAWLTFSDHGDGTATLSGTPAQEDAGQSMITLEVQDAAKAKATQSYTLRVVTETGTIRGLVYLDNDEDGQQDTNEAGMSGVTVTLTSTASAIHMSLRLNFEMSTVTGAGGTFEFERVPVGSYTVTMIAPAGYRLGKPEPAEVTVTADSVVEIPPFALRVDPNQERLFLPSLSHEQ